MLESRWSEAGKRDSMLKSMWKCGKLGEKCGKVCGKFGIETR